MGEYEDRQAWVNYVERLDAHARDRYKTDNWSAAVNAIGRAVPQDAIEQVISNAAHRSSDPAELLMYGAIERLGDEASAGNKDSARQLREIKDYLKGKK